jgi:hypothetical protein
MKSSKILESYRNGYLLNAEELDKVPREFKIVLIDFLKEKYLDNNLKNKKSIEKLSDIFGKKIINEHNTMKVPYFDVLENINLCIEVEMSDQIVEEEGSQKFGETKFSQILESGISTSNPINRFAISEKSFKSSLEDFISIYTNEFEVVGDSIKIEFN